MVSFGVLCTGSERYAIITFSLLSVMAIKLSN